MNNYYDNGQSGQGNPLYQGNIGQGAYDSQYGNSGQSGAPFVQDVNVATPAANSGPAQAAPIQQAQSGNGQKAAGYTQAGMQAAGFGYELYNDVDSISKFDVNAYAPDTIYQARRDPGVYSKFETPEEISKGTGGRVAGDNALKGAATGASIGTTIAPGWGTLIGAGVGAIGGGISGIFAGSKAKKKREELEVRQEAQENTYEAALNRYHEIQREERRALAKEALNSQRSNNFIPSYDASIYSLGNY